MRAIIAGLVIALAAAPSAQAAEDALLARLVGDWIGRGSMRTSPAAVPERVYCKMVNRLSADGRSLQQRGRCSLASNSGAVDGVIAAMGSNRYSGTLASLASTRIDPADGSSWKASEIVFSEQ